MSKQYYSQSGQDKYLNKKLFRNKRNGFFLDIGANDGVTYSNTYFFEKELGWKGICIEPIPSVFEKLENNRKSININGCISDFEGEGVFYEVSGYAEMLSGLKSKYDSRHLNRIKNEIKEYGGSLKETTVKCFNLNKILEAHNVQKIDYCSIDIEGGELDVLRTIDFNKIHVRAISVENNYSDIHIYQLLTEKGFEKITNLGGDEIYIKRRPGLFGYIKDIFLFKFGYFLL